MADKSTFTDDEWKALTEAPLLVTLALVAVGEHGPISVVKGTVASARAITHPTKGGPAEDLITQIARDAEGREARHDVEAHTGRSASEIVDGAMKDLGVVATALSKLTPDEAAEVRAWILNIANAVAGASKSVSAEEHALIDRIATTLGTPSS